MTNNTGSANEVGIIIRKTAEAEPIYADVQNKISFLRRSLTKGQTKLVYTAMHYGTNDKLATATDTLKASDALTPLDELNRAESAYTAYIFSSATTDIIASINFTTLAIPEASAWGADTNRFITGTLPYRDNEYQVYSKRDEFLLVPVFYHHVYKALALLSNDGNRTSCNPAGTACLPSPNSPNGVGVLFEQQYTGGKYNSHIFAIKIDSVLPLSAAKSLWELRDTDYAIMFSQLFT